MPAASAEIASVAGRIFSPAGEGFSVLMPPGDVQTKTTDAAKVHILVTSDGTQFLASCDAVPPASIPSVQLAGFKAGLLRPLTLTEDEPVTVGKAEGSQFTGTRERNGRTFWIHGRVLGDAERVCAFIATVPKGIDNSRAATEYVRSAKLSSDS
ncbi:MAG: hypothetical protein HOW73_22445 [Polyangiaceae bacterium]|nr:hypothetical protein [Polyangiaceae bacterium]